MKTQCWLALAGILTIACVGLSQDGRQSRRGGIAVTGARADSLKGGPVTMLTVKGSRRVSKGRLAAMSVYHALIFHPESRVMSVGGGFSNDGPLSTATVTWTVQRNPPHDYKNTEEKELKIRFHVREKTVSVGSERFPLAKGNLFVIRLNQIWLPASTQIRADLGEPAERQKVLDSFKSASPGDELIQKLELQPEGAAFRDQIRPAARLQVSR